jgi:hypothetical protein
MIPTTGSSRRFSFLIDGGSLDIPIKLVKRKRRSSSMEVVVDSNVEQSRNGQ